MGEICTVRVAVTTVGADGSATGYADSPVLSGELLSVYLDYHASAPGGTTDVAVAFKTRGGNVLAVTDNATDGLYHPRASLVTNANGAITNGHDRFALSDALRVTVAQSNALTACVTAYITYLRP